MRLPSSLVVLVLGALAFHADPARAQPAPTATLAYATLGGRALELDLYVPSGGEAPYPVVVWLHDGGWLTGTRALPAFVEPLLDRGVAIASIDYRLTTEAGLYGSVGVTFPAQLHDVKGAVRYLRANAASRDLDPRRIGAWGSSAGGHLAALAGTSGGIAALEGEVGGHLAVSSRVQAVVDYYGPTDLFELAPDVTTPPGTIVAHDPPTAPASLLLGFSQQGQGIGTLRANRANPATPFPPFVALAIAANPITHVDALDPPTLIVHGSADNQVAFRQSERLRTALAAAGVPVELVAVPGASHGGFAPGVHAQAIEFLASRLGAGEIPIGHPAALTGSWFDPASSGQGLEIQWLDGEALLAVFYGHRDDGSNLFLIGTRAGRPRYGETLEVPLVATRGGRYTALDPAAIRREPWGTLALRFDRCDRGVATLAGADGTQTLALERLSGLPGPRCD
jgi:acetyl esterase/lipase